MRREPNATASQLLQTKHTLAIATFLPEVSVGFTLGGTPSAVQLFSRLAWPSTRSPTFRQTGQAVVRCTSRTTQEEGYTVPQMAIQFGTFGDHFVHPTTSYTGIDVVGYKANRTQTRVGSFHFKIKQSTGEATVPGPQTMVAVAPKGPSYVFSPWKALDWARQGALYISFVADMVVAPWTIAP